MGKRHKNRHKSASKRQKATSSANQPSNSTSSSTNQSTTTTSSVNNSSSANSNQSASSDDSIQLQTQPTRTIMVQPEQMSLTAYQHIQNYLKTVNQTLMNKNELNAILRLSTHLRVFGLLSAVGYLNQENAQKGDVRERTKPVWRSLLGQMINPENPPEARQLMEKVKDMAKDNPTEYMLTWRKSLTLSQHWNFWGRAYAEND